MTKVIMIYLFVSFSRGIYLCIYGRKIQECAMFITERADTSYVTQPLCSLVHYEMNSSTVVIELERMISLCILYDNPTASFSLQGCRRRPILLVICTLSTHDGLINLWCVLMVATRAHHTRAEKEEVSMARRHVRTSHSGQERHESWKLQH
jgi:hypothetical protein